MQQQWNSQRSRNKIHSLIEGLISLFFKAMRCTLHIFLQIKLTTEMNAITVILDSLSIIILDKQLFPNPTLTMIVLELHWKCLTYFVKIVNAHHSPFNLILIFNAVNHKILGIFLIPLPVQLNKELVTVTVYVPITRLHSAMKLAIAKVSTTKPSSNSNTIINDVTLT